MQPGFFIHFYHQAEQLSTEHISLKTMRELVLFYGYAHDLAAVSPVFARTYVDKEKIRRSCEDFTAPLFTRMQAASTPIEEAECLDALFELSRIAVGTEPENRILDRTVKLLASCNMETPETEALRSKLACNCYWLTEEEEFKAMAERPLKKWAEQQDESGKWNELSLPEAIARLSAMKVFGTFTGDTSFETAFDRGISGYLARIFSRIVRETPDETDLSDCARLILLADLRSIIEKMQQEIYSSLTGYLVRFGQREDLPLNETALRCMNVLLLLTLRQPKAETI